MDQQFEHSCCLNVSLSHSGFTVRVKTPVLDCQYSTLSDSVGHTAEYMWLRSALLFDCQSVILRINKKSTAVIWLSIRHMDKKQLDYRTSLHIRELLLAAVAVLPPWSCDWRTCSCACDCPCAEQTGFHH